MVPPEGHDSAWLASKLGHLAYLTAPCSSSANICVPVLLARTKGKNLWPLGFPAICPRRILGPLFPPQETQGLGQLSKHFKSRTILFCNHHFDGI